MLNYKELQDEIKPGEHVQIITDTFNGGVGILKKITTTYIQVDAFVEEVNEDVESLGTFIPTAVSTATSPIVSIPAPTPAPTSLNPRCLYFKKSEFGIFNSDKKETV